MVVALVSKLFVETSFQIWMHMSFYNITKTSCSKSRKEQSLTLHTWRLKHCTLKNNLSVIFVIIHILAIHVPTATRHYKGLFYVGSSWKAGVRVIKNMFLLNTPKYFHPFWIELVVLQQDQQWSVVKSPITVNAAFERRPQGVPWVHSPILLSGALFPLVWWSQPVLHTERNKDTDP